MTVSRQSILNLYKNLYKYGQSLTFTNKDYYYRYIRSQFQSAQAQDKKKIQFLFNKGETFLKKKLLI
jgi:hypothetical protein